MKPSAASLPFCNRIEKLQSIVVACSSPGHGCVQPCTEGCATQMIFMTLKSGEDKVIDNFF